jgi:hypothetical protein
LKSRAAISRAIRGRRLKRGQEAGDPRGRRIGDRRSEFQPKERCIVDPRSANSRGDGTVRATRYSEIQVASRRGIGTSALGVGKSGG